MISINQSNANESYWMPNILPEPTEEYNKMQIEKKYYTPDGRVVNHPRWFFDNQSMVSDDYLYYNEGWKLYIDTHSAIEENLDFTKKIFLNPLNEWEIGEKYVIPSYQIYDISEELNPIINFNQRAEPKDPLEWILDRENNIAKMTWKVYDLNESQIELKRKLEWDKLRKTRNDLLNESDIIILRCYEEFKDIHPDVKTYRQQLRDLPNSIKNIEEFSGSYPKLPNSVDFYLQ